MRNHYFAKVSSARHLIAPLLAVAMSLIGIDTHSKTGKQCDEGADTTDYIDSYSPAKELEEIEDEKCRISE